MKVGGAPSPASFCWVITISGAIPVVFASCKPTMDTEFLKKSVGGPLQAALTAMVVEQPKEPVEFIGAFLLK